MCLLATATGPAVLVGHSFGAFLVLAYAATYPGDVAGLVLLDPPTEWQDLNAQRARLLISAAPGLASRRRFWRGSASSAAALALLTGGAPAHRDTFVRCSARGPLRTLEHLVGEVRKLPEEVHPVVQALWCRSEVFSRNGGAPVRASARWAMPRPRQVAGRSAAHDPLRRRSAADVLDQHRDPRAASSRSRHIIAAKSGHWIHLDEPELVVDEIAHRERLAATRAGLSTELLRDNGRRRQPFQTSRRPSIALCMVNSSAYSRSLPTGTPIAMRVTRTPSGLSSLAR